MGLRPDQIERLGDALSSAFDQFTLNQLVVTRINPLGLSAYTSIYLALPIQATNLIVQANAQDFTPELVNAARALRPKNDAFLELAAELSLTAFGRSEPQRRSDLQRTIRAKNVFNNLFLFRSRLTEIEFQVCRIEVPVTKATGETALMTGTGFLTGPDLVMTNYHVIEPLLHEVDEWTGKPADVRARFDYKKLSAKSVNDGVTYELAEPWLVDSRPYERAEEPKGGELDYAILRRARSAGHEAGGGGAEGRGAGLRDSASGAQRRRRGGRGMAGGSDSAEARLHETEDDGGGVRARLAAGDRAASVGRSAEHCVRHRFGDPPERRQDARSLPHEHRARLIRLALLQPEAGARRAASRGRS